MKKILSLFLCVLLLCSMLSITSNAVDLPDGGQLRNTGEPLASGWTTGGTEGKAMFICSVYLEMQATKYDAYSRMTSSRGDIKNNAYARAVVWKETVALAENEGYSPSSTTVTFKLYAYTASLSVTPTKATAGQTYNSTEYGSWKCGTTATTFGSP